MAKIDKLISLENSLWGFIFRWLVPNQAPKVPHAADLPNSAFLDLFNVGLTCPSFYIAVQHRVYWRYFQLGHSYLLNNATGLCGTLVNIKNNVCHLFVCEQTYDYVFETTTHKLTLWQLSLHCQHTKDTMGYIKRRWCPPRMELKF